MSRNRRKNKKYRQKGNDFHIRSGAVIINGNSTFRNKNKGNKIKKALYAYRFYSIGLEEGI